VNGFRQVTSQPAPQYQFANNSMIAGPSHATFPYQTSREVEELSRQTSVSPRDSERPIIFGGFGMTISAERFYCQEYDCGKGFSSKAHLESHTRFFHPQKVRIIFPPSGAKADVYE